MRSWIRRIETPGVSFLAAGLLIMAPLPPCWSQNWDPPNERIPRSEVTYVARTLSAETGAAVPGIEVRAQSNYTRWSCTSGDNEGNCNDCQSSPGEAYRNAEANEEGRVEATFSFVHCQYESDNPIWTSTVHNSWGTPVVVGPEDSTGSSWVVSRIVSGTGSTDDIIYLTREHDLATRFAPVIHSHRGRERQENLGDLIETVDEHSSLSAYDFTGRRVHGPSSPPPLHIVGGGLNSYGQSSTPEIWQLDIDDDWLHAGAPPGQRPLYYHVFPHGEGVVLQYWLWFNGNDLRGLPGAESRHEGDWEYLALYLESFQGEWIPQTANISQHSGGNSLDADGLWWSSSTDDGYAGLEPAYDPDRSHPHIWLAANAHAIYTRFETLFELSVNLEPICTTVYADRVDYNPGDNPRGEHSFFRYDHLVNMGEFWINENPTEGFWQWEGGPLEYIKFVGRFGDSFCVDPPGCPDTCDSPIYTQMSWAPHSPLSGDEPHLWGGFRHEPGRWGNDPGPFATVRWTYSTPIGDYLGLFETCSEGYGDTLRTHLYNGGPGGPAEVQFTTMSGDVLVHDADATGRMVIEEAADGSYTIEAVHISGSGELRLDVFIPGDPIAVLASDLRAHIESGNCEATSAIEPVGRDGAPRVGRPVGVSVRARPNPSSGTVSLELDGPLPTSIRGWQIHDTSGRLVFAASAPTGVGSLRWDGRERSGQAVAAGLYFISFLAGDGQVHTGGSFTLLR